MPVSESLAASSWDMPVHRGKRDFLGPLSFGDWQVTRFKRVGFPSRSRWSTGTEPVSFSKSRGKAGYRFVLASNREEWECDCRFVRVQRELDLGWIGAPLTYEETLDCDLRRLGGAEFWTLQVEGSLAIGGRGFKGTLAQGGRTVLLEPNHQLEGVRLPGPPLGYHFVREGNEIASAELILPGNVRISDQAGDDRDVIAAAAAALLMQPTLF
jgi:hypothetical protein